MSEPYTPVQYPSWGATKSKAVGLRRQPSNYRPPMNTAELIQVIEYLAKNPDQVRDVIPVGHEAAYFAGVGVVLRFALGLGVGSLGERKLRRKAATNHGLDPDRFPHEQMVARGLSPDEILASLARLEIEFIHSVVQTPT